jgi:hypothetical protein
MNSWLGSTKQSLIMGWGPPARTADDGAGGDIGIREARIYTSFNLHAGYDLLGL